MANVVKIRYPPVNVDSAYGTVVSVQLHKTDWVKGYLVTFSEGTLTGGTSPAWTVSKTNPAFSNLQVNYDSDVRFNMSGKSTQEYVYIVRNGAENGLTFYVPMEDYDYASKKAIEGTYGKSFIHSDNKLYVTLPALSSLTSGSPTGTSGSEIQITEVTVIAPKNLSSAIVKKIEIGSSLPANGANYLNDFIATGQAYKALLWSFSAGTVSFVKITVDNKAIVLDDYFTNMQYGNQHDFGVLPDNYYALTEFMKTEDTTELLNLVNSKSTTLEVETTAASMTFNLTEIFYAGTE